MELMHNSDPELRRKDHILRGCRTRKKGTDALRAVTKRSGGRSTSTERNFETRHGTEDKEGNVTLGLRLP